ncbi:MAG TPA: hypothetical protein ENJ52_05485 [Aliiroseovarius sp.]|nr:hypothetical protein [Aliiroseovarius sp.]
MKPKRILRGLGLAGALVLTSLSGAWAVEARATTDLNVRTGPGTTFSILDALTRGEEVSIVECTDSNWCYINQDGPDGWVSARYLEAVPVAPPPPPPGSPPSSGERDCEFRLVLGPGAPRLEMECTDPTPPPPPPPPPTPTPAPGAADEACFYRDANFAGPYFCVAPSRLDTLGSAFDDKISSIKLSGDAIVKVCVDQNMGGYCTRIYNDAPTLGALINDRISSLRVYVPGVPGTPPPGPVTYSTGGIKLAPGEHADLDDGTKGGSGTDIWYRSGGAGLLARVKPIRGAKIALGDGSSRGYAGCSAASYSTDPVPLWMMPVGTYVCVKTNQGRISQFRVNSTAGGKLKIGYTTWAR